MFVDAVRSEAFVRIALMGPPGSGKTYSALLIAKHMGAKKIAVIDSERGSAKLYSHLVPFKVAELTSFAAERYIEAIDFAERAGVDVLIIDSLSHAWAGKDGILEFKDKRTEQSRSKDSFGAGWRDASPLHNRLIDRILAFKGHVIATLRTKTEYVIEENAQGKKTPRKIGLAPVQREGVEYEFTIVGDFIDANKLAITKTRIDTLNDAVIYKPGAELARTITDWLASAEPAPEAAKPTKHPKRVEAEGLIRTLWAEAQQGAAALGQGAIDQLTADADAIGLANIMNPEDAPDTAIKPTRERLAQIVEVIRAAMNTGNAA